MQFKLMSCRCSPSSRSHTLDVDKLSPYTILGATKFPRLTKMVALDFRLVLFCFIFVLLCFVLFHFKGRRLIPILGLANFCTIPNNSLSSACDTLTVCSLFSYHNHPTWQSNEFHLPLPRIVLSQNTFIYTWPHYWNPLNEDIIAARYNSTL